MDWSTNPPLPRLVTDLLGLRLRAERLSLLQKVQTAEAQALAMGVPIEGLALIRQTLARHPLVPVPEPFLRLPRPVKIDQRRPLRHVQVVPRRGSIF